MTDEIDHAVYALFERIVQEAPSATYYEVSLPDTRGDGSIITLADGVTPRLFITNLKADEKDRIPWGGFDTVKSVAWYPQGAGGPSITLKASFWARGISLDTFDGYHAHDTRMIGVYDVVKFMPMTVVAVDEDGVVSEVLRRLNAELEFSGHEPADDDTVSDEFLPVGWRSIDDGEY